LAKLRLGLSKKRKTQSNQHGSNSGFELAKSRGFEQIAVTTVRSPRQRVIFFKIGESFGRKNSIRSTAYKQALEGLKY
jgi:hypothetical protein